MSMLEITEVLRGRGDIPSLGMIGCSQSRLRSNGYILSKGKTMIEKTNLTRQEPAAQPEQFEGISIRVLPCCGNTLLQITATMKARFIQFTHPDHTSKKPTLCRHAKPSGERIQAVLKDGDRGTLAIDVGAPSTFPNERTISFLVRDVELADIGNPHNIPLKIKIV